MAKATVRLEKQNRCFPGVTGMELKVEDGIVAEAWIVKWSAQHRVSNYEGQTVEALTEHLVTECGYTELS